MLKATDTTSPYSFALDTATLSNAQHNLQAKAFDAANNIGTSSIVTVTVNNPVPDTTAPTVSITSPASGSTFRGSAFVSVSASDNIGMSKVELYVDGALMYKSTTSSYTFMIDKNGLRSIYAKGYDKDGNTAVSNTIQIKIVA